MDPNERVSITITAWTRGLLEKIQAENGFESLESAIVAAIRQYREHPPGKDAYPVVTARVPKEWLDRPRRADVEP